MTGPEFNKGGKATNTAPLIEGGNEKKKRTSASPMEGLGRKDEFGDPQAILMYVLNLGNQTTEGNTAGTK
ncbi:MAG: hypothetical protein UY21_C0007G0013 [Microgenomates group bacterium GW2011_GWA1_48_10]|uniref:Uncharacterized protein n=1 Tax=Candidatus Gottesmanbacteria bacterium RIFCSPHIGHO2_01_FULL_47_48 TaxID=1798381 RepID=A0A1F6A2R9_9BACT|nr:MAG: hypothetical protein UY21_C0007G0013 [Microgenomates group bacterium GW2011_GWA1_48_10]OGG18959.1 MAG: hypothetical protein A2721_02360 [Candidatus Gottesmanbacteria bacterium RIFCSPHIGHO2_01_FULL_47_48]